MTKTLKIDGIDTVISPGFLERIADKSRVELAAGKQHSSQDASIVLSNEVRQVTSNGKEYPGLYNYTTHRYMARKSAIVSAIINLRKQQVAKMPFKIIPKNEEPPRQVSVLKYTSAEIQTHPAFDENDVIFLLDVYDRLDPKGYTFDKREELKKNASKFSQSELETIAYLDTKQNDFYSKRNKDKMEIEKLLNSPDSIYSDATSWTGMLQKLIDDILTIDRGFIVKMRNTVGELKGLMVVDGASIKPVLNHFGYMDKSKAFVQDAGAPGVDNVYISRKDAIPFIMNPITDTRFFGYGLAPMDTVFELVLADIYIDKGLADYYRKGGVPEGFINLSPPVSKDGVYIQLDQEHVDSVQRQMQAAVTGQSENIPVISGADASWVALKGSRKDNQYEELAQYSLKKICAVFQVSPSDVGFTDGYKQSDGAVQNEITQSKGLETLMTLISQVFTSEVLNEIRHEGDLKLWFDEKDLARQKAEFEIVQMKLQANYISINEARSMLDGLSPQAWGNTPLQGTQSWVPEDPSAGPTGGLPPLNLPGMGAPGGAPSPLAPPAPGGSTDLPPVTKSVFED